MKTRKTLILSVCALVLPTLCTTPIWSQGFGPTPVGATAARSAEVQAAIHLSGSVQAIHRALVASEVPGVVEEISVREGAVVEVGDMLIQLRNTVLLKDLAGAKAQLAEALARHQLASTALERSQNLHETGIVSRQQFDDRSAEVQAWQGRADQARALIGRLEASIAASTVRAPFSGIVVREHCQLGEWVAAGGGVVELADRDRLEVVVSVPERHFAGARVGSRARVSFDALPDLDVEGEITAVIPQANPQTRSFPVKVAIGNPDGRIGIGMSASVAFPGSDSRVAVIVPKDAIMSQGAQRLVYRIEDGPSAEDGTPTEVASSIHVVLGAGLGEWVEVDGIQEGDRIVTRGNERLMPGAAVAVSAVEYGEP